MANVVTELRISEEVAAQTQECVEFVVPAGPFTIESFVGDAAFDINCAVKLVWDFQGAGEQIIWTHKGAAGMPFVEDSLVGDGVKKVAVCLENSLTTGGVFMSGYAKIVQET